MKTEADILGTTKVGTYKVKFFGETKIAEKHTHPEVTDEMWLIDGELWPTEMIDKILEKI